MVAITLDKPVHQVVTSVVDSFEPSTNSYALSIREAIDLTNSNNNIAENIWLPAWSYILIRDRKNYGTGTTDTDISFGDLNITDSLTLRGAGTGTTRLGSVSVEWSKGLEADSVFELLGDFNNNGVVDSDGDRDIWNENENYGTLVDATFEMGDADGDGDVDGQDFLLRQQNLGNTLSIFGIL